MIPWQEIETVLLDMDGTLLDKHFDDYFWEHFVPEIYANKNDISERDARKKLLDTYRAKEGTLDWTDLDYWSEQLDLDIPALKIKVDHLIQVHPYVIDFLEHLKKLRKPVFLVTNAHSKTLDIKMAKTSLSGYFTGIVCAEEIGMAKEDPAFWAGLKKKINFQRQSTMLAEDTEKVLISAQSYGIKHLIYVARPSSQAPIKASETFPS
ncbi:MAG: HAD hydrolase-like protein, partial [Rectinemataceae bacterium]|nr:HAD hydrolase-like protein [Rectinemataceae bacterium]